MQALLSPSRLGSSRVHRAAGAILQLVPWRYLSKGKATVIAIDEVAALSQACLQDQPSAMAIVDDWIRQGIELETIYLQGISPACQLFNEWWQDDSVDFANITLASCRLQRVLYELSPLFLEHANQKTNGYEALLLSSSANQHNMGSFMLGEFFKRNGWSVSSLACDGDAEIEHLLQREWFDVVGYSVCTRRCLAQARFLLPNIRRYCANPNVRVMVGGPLATADPEFAAKLGADFVGGDARDSEQLALRSVRARDRRL